jgi:hypothetical protein
MKVELSLSELSTLAADNLFLAKQWLEHYRYFRERDPESSDTERSRKMMLGNLKMYRKLRSFYMN